MANVKKAKVESTSDASPDRLSSLPLVIKGNILSCLNAEDAVRTSILSSNWLDTWTTMPQILLCDCRYGTFEDSLSRPQPSFVSLVDRVLALHKGQLDGFTITGNKNYHDSFFTWMDMLSMKSPSSIAIKLTSVPKYSIPSCIFCIAVLEYLRIKNCIIRLPRAFKSFKLLTLLNLKDFSSTDDDIKNLISSCPKLNVLVLKFFKGIGCLTIQAPELQYLKVDGMFEDFLLDASNLENANVTLQKSEAYQSVPVVHGGKSYLKQALGSLTNIKSLIINGYLLTYLSKGCILTKLPIVFDHLENIIIEICFWDQREVLTACSLLQNAPTLKELELWSFPWSKAFGPISMWDQELASIKNLTMEMDHLVSVSVNDFRGLDYEVAFVGKLLSWAPILEELEINQKFVGDIELESMVLKKLLALPRVSDKAKVIVN